MLNVMLVEDEANIRSGLKKLVDEVSGCGRVVAEAANGREALLRLAEADVDLIITDIRMPEMDGLEMLKALRAQSNETQVIVLSGYPEFDYAKQAIRYRVQDYLLKPVDVGEFVHCLRRMHEKIRSEGRPSKAQEMNGVHPVIRRAVEYMERHLHEDVTLAALADYLHFNPDYLSQLFRTEAGQSFTDMMIRMRMERAARLLTETHLKIYQIARLCGYSSEKHFMIVFKKLMGTTPTDYRRLNTP